MKNKRRITFRFILVMAVSIGVLPWMSRHQKPETDGAGQISEESDVAGGSVESLQIQTSYDFENEETGRAYGIITVTANQEGTYYFYWGDHEGEKLEYDGVEYSELGSCEIKADESAASYHIPSPYTVIPDGAEQLLVYDESENLLDSVEIPEEKWFQEGAVLYEFGLMSDVHFNRYSDYSDDDAVEAFHNALAFMDSRGIDFVGISGDLSMNGEIGAYEKFNEAVSQYPEMTVYTTTGNHDCANLEDFKMLINSQNKEDENVKDISNEGMDFVYEKNGDIFIFFSQVKAGYTPKKEVLVTQEQLDWLEDCLNTYADRNVYLFFHTYFASESGDVRTGVGNLENPGGYTYELTYPFGNEDESRFRELLGQNPNVTMFSGHSHWAYDQQKYNPYLNIGNIRSDHFGASLVHISSVSAPRTIEEEAKERDENNGVMSEGMIAIRYENNTVYLGVDFKNGKYLAYASYID